MRVHRDWLLTPQRLAIHLPTATGVVADLHLGYEQARVRRGEALPDFGLDETIAALRSAFAVYEVKRLVMAGDLVENLAYTASAAALLSWLGAEGVELTAVIPGNHDRRIGQAVHPLPVRAEGVELGGWRVVHGDGKLPGGKLVLGHWHPCLRLGNRVTAPCYLIGPERIVLPAFSLDAAGVNVLGQPAWRTYACHVITGDEVLNFGPVSRLQVGKPSSRRRKG